MWSDWFRNTARFVSALFLVLVSLWWTMFSEVSGKW
jgi:hypothetical protein